MKNKTRGLLFYIVLTFLFCISLFGIRINVSANTAFMNRPATGAASHGMQNIGRTRDGKKSLNYHYLNYNGTTYDAFCLSAGYSARNGSVYYPADWDNAEHHQILRYVATYMAHDAFGTENDENSEYEDTKLSGGNYNYLTMQAICWAIRGYSPYSKNAYVNGFESGDSYIHLKQTDKYTDPEITFSENTDRFVSQLIMQMLGEKEYSTMTEEQIRNHQDLCKTCGGYGYLYKIKTKSRRRYYTDGYFDGVSYTPGYWSSWSSWTTEDTQIVTEKEKEKINPPSDSYGYDRYGNYYQEQFKLEGMNNKIECTNIECDLFNYWEENYVTKYDGNQGYWEAWQCYSELKFFVHTMCQIPSYAARTDAEALAKVIEVKWTGHSYEAQLTDTNFTNGFYLFEDRDGFHFNITKGRVIITYNGKSDPNAECDIDDYKTGVAKGNVKFEAENAFMKNQMADVQFWKNQTGSAFQNFMTIYRSGTPTKAIIYVKVVPPYVESEDPAARCEVRTEIEVVDLNDHVVDYILPGEKYKLRYTFIYEGGSKGLGLKRSDNIPYTESRYRRVDVLGEPTQGWQMPNQTYLGWKYDVFMERTTDLNLWGTYDVYTSPYTNKDETFTWSSEKHSVLNNNWNVKGFLDAGDVRNTIDSFLDTSNNSQWGGFTVKSYTDKNGNKGWETEEHPVKEEANSTTTKELDQAYQMTVVQTSDDKKNPEMIVTWAYETPYQVFRTPKVDSQAYIYVGKSENQWKSYPTDKHKEEMNGKNLAETNVRNIVRTGPYKFVKLYYDMEEVHTNNAIYPAEYQQWKDWKLITDVDVTQFHVSTGDGKTSPVDILSQKYLNHQFYYAIKLVNDKANIDDSYTKWADNKAKIDKHTNQADHKITNITGIDDIVETDVTTKLMVNSSQILLQDHIRTGTTLLQKALPVVVNVNEAKTNNFRIAVNVDNANYNSTRNGYRTYYETEFDNSPSNNNTKTDIDKVVKAINPTKLDERPESENGIYNINDSNLSQITKFKIKLDGSKIDVVDTSVFDYKDKAFAYNKNNLSNAVYAKTNGTGTVIKQTDEAFEQGPYYKYSKTNFRTLKNNAWNKANANDSDYTPEDTQVSEYYRFTKVLFRSNYTSKYVEDDTIDEEFTDGQTGWVDFAADQDREMKDKKAAVSAGQGFELKICLTYFNNNLELYRSKQVEKYAAIKNSSNIMSSNNPRIGKQYMNQFYQTIYNGSEETGLLELVDLEGNPVETYGSNVYEDLYAIMSDNQNTAYSYSGIYDTMQIFDVEKKVTADEENNTIRIDYWYTMKKSEENGVGSDFQTMRFYTNQLEQDSMSNLSKKHKIKIYSAVFPANEIDDDVTLYSDAQSVRNDDKWNFDNVQRYLGDYLDFEYKIIKTGADDSIVHIVQ